MTIYKKIINKIDKDDWNIVIASPKMLLLEKLRSHFPMKNIWLSINLTTHEPSYRDKKTYTLIISKRHVHKIRKEDWKKVIVY